MAGIRRGFSDSRDKEGENAVPTRRLKNRPILCKLSEQTAGTVRNQLMIFPSSYSGNAHLALRVIIATYCTYLAYLPSCVMLAVGSLKQRINRNLTDGMMK